MTSRLLMILVTIAAFGVLTVLALMETGYFGLFEMQLQSFAGLQVLIDLVIVCLLACIWMVRDARERGLIAWPFVVLTFAAGSFGPLFYLAMCELKTGAPRPAAA